MATVFGVELSFLLVIVGIGLAIAEAMLPGGHFIVLGIALFLAGLIGLLFPPFAAPFILAVLVLGFGLISLYVYREFDFYGGNSIAKTTDSQSLRGKTGRVTERITKEEGKVKLHGGGFNPFYSARSVAGVIPEGTEVIVVSPGGGNVLTVESLDVIEDDIDRELAAGRKELERDRELESE